MSAGSNLPSMSNAAFAGFLRLMLTPLNEAPAPSPELRAYLDYHRATLALKCDGLGDEDLRQLVRIVLEE